MNTVKHQAAQLRQEIIEGKEKLFREVEQQSLKNVNELPDDKSEIDPPILDAHALKVENLEKPPQSNKKSSWNSVFSFWRDSSDQQTTRVRADKTDQLSRVYEI